MPAVTVYKNGTSMKVNDFDLEYYKKQGWSKSPSSGGSDSGSSSSSNTVSDNNPPKPQPSETSPSPEENQMSNDPRMITVYKDGLSKNIPSLDFAYWQNQGWTKTKPSEVEPVTGSADEPIQADEPESSNPPSGATLINDPNELSQYTEDEIWRDPNSNKIYKLSGATGQEPISEPEPTTGSDEGGTGGQKDEDEDVQEPTDPANSGQLNTAGLLEAWTRKQQGRATEQDLANLEYARSKGWTPAGGAPSEEDSGPVDSGETDTPDPDTTTDDIPGLNTEGLAEAYARKVAGTATDTDLANLEYARSKGWKPAEDIDADTVESETANEVINSQQDSDMSAYDGEGDFDSRMTVEDIMDQINEAITPDAEDPEAPDYEQELRDLRTEYGIGKLEDRLSKLNKQLNDAYATRDQRIRAEQDKTVATNVIAGRVGEVEQQEMDRIAAIERSINVVQDQLNTKYDVVNSLMDAKELDYTTAQKAYDSKMNEKIQLFNQARGIQEQLKTEEQRQVDNARASAEILMDGYRRAGKTFADLTVSQQTSLKKLAVQSGFDPDFYKTALDVAPEKEILTHVISDDKSYATMIYKDGTTNTIPTGQPAGSNDSAGGSSGGGYGGVSSGGGSSDMISFQEFYNYASNKSGSSLSLDYAKELYDKYEAELGGSGSNNAHRPSDEELLETVSTVSERSAMREAGLNPFNPDHIWDFNNNPEKYADDVDGGEDGYFEDEDSASSNPFYPDKN